MSKPFPARLHPILAREAPTAVIFRRGPSKAVCTVSWDRRNDRFEVAQWLHGRIYERRADLSADGKHLIYFAMNGKWQSETRGAWTAVSRAPWLKAISLFPKGDCWNGGGLFLDNRRFWLNDGCGHPPLQESDEVSCDPSYAPSEHYGSECTGVYYPRLLRDGWTLRERRGVRFNACTCFEKTLPHGWTLEKTAHEQVGAPPGKGCYWDEHALLNESAGTVLAYPDWEWAEFDNGRLLFCRQGSLFAVSIESDRTLGSPVELFDFNALAFSAAEAPY